MNFALPCVVSNVRGNKDLIVDGEGGFVCEQNDYISFAKAFRNLIANKEKQEQMGAENLNNSKQYEIEFIKEQLEKIYKEI